MLSGVLFNNINVIMEFDWLSDDQVDKLAVNIHADIASGRVVTAPNNLLECGTLEQLFAFIGQAVGIHWGTATERTQEGEYTWLWKGEVYDDQTVELVSVAWSNIAGRDRLVMIVCENTNVSSVGFERLVKRVSPVKVKVLD